MQQAQQNKVVVDTEAKKDVERKAAGQAPMPLSPELLRLVGGGNSTTAPGKGW